jgi:hypothetical protein
VDFISRNILALALGSWLLPNWQLLARSTIKRCEGTIKLGERR